MAQADCTRLGLIGEGISRSLAPRLHEHLGRVHGIPVSYTLMDGRNAAAFDPVAVAGRCAKEGFVGVNVTQPFKRVLRAHVDVQDERIGRIGSVNTVLFGRAGQHGSRAKGQGWIGTNTDYTGFLKAYRAQFGRSAPGRVLMAGAGGVGRAIAFALAELGPAQIRIFDVDEKAARDLAEGVAGGTGIPASGVAPGDLVQAMAEGDGLVNATPLGTHLRPGSAFPAEALKGGRWAFDAVYTPVWTEFLLGARRAGIDVLTGFELFFHQGLDAFEAFTGRATDPEAVRGVVSGWVTAIE